MWYVVAFVVCGFIFYMLFNNKNMKMYNHYMKRKKKLEESINFFTATQKYSNQNMVIAINEEEKKLCVSTMKKGNPVPLMYEFNDISSCEVIEYGVTETDASLNGKVGGQRVASVLADSVDRVMGGAVEDRINRIDLKISVNDSQNPFVLANFLFWEVTKDSEEYKKASDDASHWCGVIDKLIKGKRNKQSLAVSI